ncbi:alcohol dehydrogenase [Flagelloscypha sp. PMI_526]|nr:alcohol dehydrogenase [Flagelloscypha sp. PMI_526]
MSVTNGRLLFKTTLPHGSLPEPGKHLEWDSNEKIDPAAVPLDGGILAQTIFLAVEPYIAIKMGFGAYEIGKSISNCGIVKVIRSENKEICVGDHLYGSDIEFSRFIIRKDLSGLKVLQNPYKLPWSAFLSVIGMPGHTAYTAWKEHASAKQGETVFITSGAGSVGSFVIQLAKADGLKVIASAGSNEKIDFMKECGADIAFNYRETDTREVLAKEGPIDIFWDGVGGDTFMAALDHAAIGARFIECGMISSSTSGPRPVQNLFQVIPKSISIFGVVVSRLLPKYAKEFDAIIPEMVSRGNIKWREEITEGMENTPQLLGDVFAGKITGKAIIKI